MLRSLLLSCLLCWLVVSGGTVCPAELIGHFRLEGDLTDSSPSGSTVGGNSGVFIPGPAGFGQAMQFDSAAANHLIIENPTVFGTITEEVTVAFWQYGSANQPAADSAFSATDGAVAYQTMLNCQLPWNDEIVYWYSWNGSGTVNRVYKSVAGEPGTYQGSWNHWTFVKNTAADDVAAATARIKIYLNGALSYNSADHGHSLGDGTASLAGIGAFFIGSAYGSRYFYDGAIDDFRIYNHELPASEVALLPLNTRATGPLPGDGAVNLPSDIVLRWIGAGGATAYHLYLGNDLTAVTNATPASPQFCGEHTEATFVNPGGFEPGRPYYWRVDSIVGAVVQPGDVWSFTTAASCATLGLTETADTVELDNGVQKVVFTRQAGASGAPLTTGKFNSAAAFTGQVAELLTIYSISSFNATSLTVEFWAKPADLDTYQVMVGRGPKTPGHFEVYANRGGGASYYVKTSTADNIGESTFNIADNQWHFISFRMNAGSVSLSVDGTEILNDSLSGTRPSTTEPIYVGSLPAAEAPWQFPITGAIDDLRISNTWRSSIAKPTSAFAADGNTIGLYPFDSANGDVFPDLSSSNNPAHIPGGLSYYEVETYVKDGDTWTGMFDGRRPLIEGSSFNLLPTGYAVVEDSPQRKAVLFAGDSGYDWDALVEVNSGSPLVDFTVTCHLNGGLTLGSDLQPIVAFWMNQSDADVVVEQGPMSLYGPHCFGASFPAAYLWHDDKEAVFFYDMTEATWMTSGNIRRFLDCRVQKVVGSGQCGIGLNTFRKVGTAVPAGDMVHKFSLYASTRPGQPSKLEGLDKMVDVCSPLHAATADWPTNRIAPYELSWQIFAQNAIEELMIDNVMWHDEYSGWNDAPLNLVDPVSYLRAHAGRPHTTAWDFSCVNNHLSAWIMYTRLHPNQAMHDFATIKKNALPLFYDPQSRMIRHGTRQPAHVGDLAMSWQNFYFHFELIRSHRTLAAEDFNPAIAGRLLMATEGLRDLAHNVNYVFPQWFDPYTKIPIIQNDVPQLGIVYEPWQAGSYAYVMLYAYEVTGKATYLDEARSAITTLLTTMTFTVDNDVYTQYYDDPADFPIAELFGNAYGLMAAYRIYELTGDTAFVQYSEDFLNSMLRLTFWYEDNVNAYSRDLGNLGLFHPHGGAYNSTPWENSEAHLALAWLIKHNKSLGSKKLLLKLLNLNRVNAYHYFPATYTPLVRTLGIDDSVNPYHPVEPFYASLEAGGHSGMPAAYMASQGIWNHWMYDALAQADNRDIMVLNTDCMDDFDTAAASVQRNLIAFNPTDDPLTFALQCKSLAEGNYHVTVKYEKNACDFNNDQVTDLLDFSVLSGQWHSTPSDPSADVAPLPLDNTVDALDLMALTKTWLGYEYVGRSTLSKAQLLAGLQLQLAPLTHAEITVTHADAAALQADIDAVHAAQDALVHAYQLLQVRQRDHGDVSIAMRNSYLASLTDYENANYAAATAGAQGIIDALSP